MFILTNNKKIYINIDLFKSRLKKAVMQLLKALTVASGFCGFCLMVKSAGMHEADTITFSEALFLMLKGGIFCGISYILKNIKNDLQ